MQIIPTLLLKKKFQRLFLTTVRNQRLINWSTRS